MAETSQAAEHDESRRDFLVMAAIGMGAVGASSFVWPLIDQMNPSADVLALASTEVDLSKIEVGQNITIKWRGKPVFVRRRTAEEIKIAEAVTADQLPDPQTDADRVKNGLDHVAIADHVPRGVLGEAFLVIVEVKARCKVDQDGEQAE